MANRNFTSFPRFGYSSSNPMDIDMSLSAVALAPVTRPRSATSLSPRTEQSSSWVNADDESMMAAFGIVMLTDGEDIYKIKKVLMQSDVDGNCRLLLKKDLVVQHILPFLGEAEVQLCGEKEGLVFTVYDIDDNSVHQLRLKRWKNTRYFVLIGGWIPNFVIRKNLEVGDQIGIAMFGGRLFFKLLKKKLN